MRLLPAFLIGLVLCLSSCAHPEMYYRYHSFEESSWHKDSVVRFDLPVTDTLSSYDVFIEVRNNNKYPYKNLWLFVDFQLPSGETRRDTVEINLADDYGKWYGKGLSLYELTVPYEQNRQYHHKGSYVYTIQQAMRDDILTGISDIGLKISTPNK